MAIGMPVASRCPNGSLNVSRGRQPVLRVKLGSACRPRFVYFAWSNLITSTEINRNQQKSPKTSKNITRVRNKHKDKTMTPTYTNQISGKNPWKINQTRTTNKRKPARCKPPATSAASACCNRPIRNTGPARRWLKEQYGENMGKLFYFYFYFSVVVRFLNSCGCWKRFIAGFAGSHGRRNLEDPGWVLRSSGTSNHQGVKCNFSGRQVLF